MGQCYIIDWYINYPDEKKPLIVTALRDFIHKQESETTANFNLKTYAAKGYTPDTWDGVMTLLFTDRGTKISDHHIYAAFDASYGWENVITAAFKAVMHLVENTSMMLMETDDGSSKLTIKNGDLECEYEEYEDDYEDKS